MFSYFFQLLFLFRCFFPPLAICFFLLKACVVDHIGDIICSSCFWLHWALWFWVSRLVTSHFAPLVYLFLCVFLFFCFCNASPLVMLFLHLCRLSSLFFGALDAFMSCFSIIVILWGVFHFVLVVGTFEQYDFVHLSFTYFSYIMTTHPSPPLVFASISFYCYCSLTAIFLLLLFLLFTIFFSPHCSFLKIVCLFFYVCKFSLLLFSFCRSSFLCFFLLRKCLCGFS